MALSFVTAQREQLFPDCLQANERTVEYGVDIELKFIHPT